MERMEGWREGGREGCVCVCEYGEFVAWRVCVECAGAGAGASELQSAEVNLLFDDTSPAH